MTAKLATLDDRFLALAEEAAATTSEEHPHLVNSGEVKRMSAGDFFQRIADHEKQYIDQLKNRWPEG